MSEKLSNSEVKCFGSGLILGIVVIGMVAVCVSIAVVADLRTSAIKAGVAEYVIIDSLSGNTKFTWKTNHATPKIIQ